METRHLFVINPVAGLREHTEKLRPQIEAAGAKLAQRADVRLTEYKGHTVSLIQEVVRTEPGAFWRVYACGGDGTLQETVTAAMSLPNVSISHMPCGTGNDFVRQFGENSPLFMNPEALMQGEILPTDVMRLDTTRADGSMSQCFAINIASAGFDARVTADMRRFHWSLRFGSRVPYYLAVVYNLVLGLHKPYQVTIDGEPLDDRYTLMAACNGEFYGGGFHPMPDAVIDDGLLDFLLIRKVSRLKAASLVEKYAAGKYGELGDLAVWRRGHRMELICEKEELLNLDGENLPSLKAVFSLAERKLGFIVPQGVRIKAVAK